MKEIKKLSILLIICLCMIVGVNSVLAEPLQYFETATTDSSVVVIPNSGMYHLNGYGGSSSTIQSVFCLNYKNNYYGGATYEYFETDHNTGYACAVFANSSTYSQLSNAQGLNGNLTNGLSASSAYVSLQNSIWNLDTTYKTNSSTYPNVNSTCNNIPATTCTTGGTPTANVMIIEEIKFTLSGDYYVSDKINVTLKDTTKYSIKLTGTVPTGTIITDSLTGTTNVTETSSTGLYIKVPRSTLTGSFENIKVELTPMTTKTCTSHHAYAYKYAYRNPACTSGGSGICGPNDDFRAITEKTLNSDSSEPGFQYLALLHYETQQTTETITGKTTSFTAGITLGQLEVTKVNTKNNKPIEGVKFELYLEDGKTEATHANGHAIVDLVTDVNGKITVKYLYPGNYVLKEISGVEGYITTEKEYPIQIIGDETKTLTVTNNPVLTKISKKDIANEKELVGAHIVITDEEGNKVQEFDSAEDPYEFYIGPGKYKLTETVAPKGYDKVETVFEFEILNNGNVKLLSTESDNFKTNKNEIILYNSATVVKVPDTFKSNMILSIVGIFLSIAGAAVIIFTIRKRKVNEI